jgi:hypothetical protein
MHALQTEPDGVLNLIDFGPLVHFVVDPTTLDPLRRRHRQPRWPDWLANANFERSKFEKLKDTLMLVLG